MKKSQKVLSLLKENRTVSPDKIASYLVNDLPYSSRVHLDLEGLGLSHLQARCLMLSWWRLSPEIQEQMSLSELIHWIKNMI